MIVVVEGVSASGKTFWCRRDQAKVVGELAPLSPPSGNALLTAQFWTDAHCQRWKEAERLESKDCTVYCDTDPIKLHYPWCLWQIGRGSYEDWVAASQTYRAALRSRAIGFADVVLFLEPTITTIRKQKEGDTQRRRRNFELHLQIGPALQSWHEIIDRLSCGRVIWHGENLPEVDHVPARTDRYSVELFDEIIATATDHRPVISS
jgi:hypothetical protein